MEIFIVVVVAVTTKAPERAMSWAWGGFSPGVDATIEGLTPPWMGFSALYDEGDPDWPEAGER
jgi:hypothetical protein